MDFMCLCLPGRRWCHLRELNYEYSHTHTEWATYRDGWLVRSVLCVCMDDNEMAYRLVAMQWRRWRRFLFDWKKNLNGIFAVSCQWNVSFLCMWNVVRDGNSSRSLPDARQWQKHAITRNDNTKKTKKTSTTTRKKWNEIWENKIELHY